MIFISHVVIGIGKLKNMATPSENAASTWRVAGNGAWCNFLRLKHNYYFEMENEQKHLVSERMVCKARIQ